MNDYTYFSLENLKKSVVDDNDFLIVMLETFVTNTYHSLDKMQSYVAVKDWKKTGEVAHKMLSSYKHLEIIHLIPYLNHLEQLIWHDSSFKEILIANDMVQHHSLVILERLKEIIASLKS